MRWWEQVARQVSRRTAVARRQRGGCLFASRVALDPERRVSEQGHVTSKVGPPSQPSSSGLRSRTLGIAASLSGPPPSSHQHVPRLAHDNDIPTSHPPMSALHSAQVRVVRCCQWLERAGERLTGAIGPFFIALAVFLMSLGCFCFCEYMPTFRCI